MKPNKPIMILILGIVLMLAAGVSMACTATAGVTKPAEPADKVAEAATQSGEAVAGKTEGATKPAEPAAGTMSSLMATMEVEPKTVHVGDNLVVNGSGFTPGQAVDIVWGTLEGDFKLGEYQEFIEQYFKEALRTLINVTADNEGKIQYVYQVAEDYGGAHNVMAYIEEGQQVGKTSVEIRPQFEVTPLEGPVGTEITVKATGIGYRKWEDARSINWDNKMVGFFNGLTTSGSSTVRIRATGSVGPHLLTVWNGYYPYLNIQQAPTYYLLPEEFKFVVTDGEPAFTGWVSDWPEKDYSELEGYSRTIGPEGELLKITPNVGTVGTKLKMEGNGFKPGSTVEIQWEAMRGNRRAGWNPETTSMLSIPVASDGSFSRDITMPDDLGGYHAVVAMVDGQRVADARVIIQPDVVEFAPTSGPVGTPIKLHLKGVGWTELDNIYVMTYDNAFAGYACGFSTEGDVTIISVNAAGEPGWHVISMWPSVYQGASLEQYNTPWLDYHDNHPGLPLPAFHFAFKITE